MPSGLGGVAVQRRDGNLFDCVAACLRALQRYRARLVGRSAVRIASVAISRCQRALVPLTLVAIRSGGRFPVAGQRTANPVLGRIRVVLLGRILTVAVMVRVPGRSLPRLDRGLVDLDHVYHPTPEDGLHGVRVPSVPKATRGKTCGASGEGGSPARRLRPNRSQESLMPAPKTLPITVRFLSCHEHTARIANRAAPIGVALPHLEVEVNPV